MPQRKVTLSGPVFGSTVEDLSPLDIQKLGYSLSVISLYSTGHDVFTFPERALRYKDH
jgi:hypothetical protein